MIQLKLIPLFLSLIFLCFFFDPADSADPNTRIVHTSVGDIIGIIHTPVPNQGAIQSFYSIPYATPPIGSMRWVSPQPHLPWSTPFNATISKQIECLNGASWPAKVTSVTGVEDCLVLTILTPNVTAPLNGFPVVIWICGGGMTGCGEENGESLVSTTQSLIYISIQYRLGVMGFLNIPEISSAGSNFGLQDQTAALQWVHDHIADFNGNPNQVTIQGESAGSMSVCLHMMMKKSFGLFHRSIMESGGCDMVTFTLDVALNNSLKVINNTVCGNSTDRLICLQKLDPLTLVQAQANVFMLPSPPTTVLPPTIDGVIITDDPIILWKTGQYYPVPSLLGTNTGEGRAFLYPHTPDYTWTDVVNLASRYSLGNTTVMNFYNETEYIKHYPLQDDPSYSIIDVLGSWRYHCSNVRTAEYLYDASIKQIWYYQFQYVPSFDNYPRAQHGDEVRFVFANTGSDWNDDMYILSAQMQNYWARFIANAEPNVNVPNQQIDNAYMKVYGNWSLHDWPAYNPEGDGLALLFHSPPTQDSHDHFAFGYISHPWQIQCALWDPIVP